MGMVLGLEKLMRECPHCISTDMSMKSGPGKDAPPGLALNEQMNQVVSLLEARTRGEVGNADVENAVSGLLSGSTSQRTSSADGRGPTGGVPQIQEDLDDYDNLDDDPPPPRVIPSTSSSKKTMPKPTVASMRRKGDRDEIDPLAEIPLGREGARMMVTFGDGHKPNPETVSTALLGARQCLQVAIKDARALRRHAKDEYLRARRVARLGKDKKAKLGPEDHEQDHVDPNMLYRAMAGYDRLAYDPPCGFDVDQLRQLFPEEMNAYNRWNQMHKAYEASSKEDGAGATSTVDDGDTDGRAKDEQTDSGVPRGHLEERAAQFDARTDQMKKDWYLKFSEVRQGSFLPRRKGKQTAGEKEWDASRTKAERGRRKEDGSWLNKSAATVKFLHWVGFDPQSALPPPSDETAAALAFLAYDFLGKIIEKAVYLRNSQVNSSADGDEGDSLLELGDGEQLSREDVEKALNDSDIKPVSLYNAPEGKGHGQAKKFAPQLYFGPGFEDRLEMEMAELASGTNKRKALSEEELDIRRREDAVFEEVAKPPCVWAQRKISSSESGEKSTKL